MVRIRIKLGSRFRVSVNDHVSELQSSPL